MTVKSGKLKTTSPHAEDFSLIPSNPEDSLFFPSQDLQLDLDHNLLLLEHEAAFFQFALKEIHDLTG